MKPTTADNAAARKAHADAVLALVRVLKEGTAEALAAYRAAAATANALNAGATA